MLSKKIWDSVYGDSIKILKINKSRKRKQMLFGILFGAYVGYQFGYNVSDKENKEKFLTIFESEDQLFHIIKNEKKSIFIEYFNPGDVWHNYFRADFLKMAKETHEKVAFVQINCRKFYDICRTKKIEVSPTAELWKCDQGSPRGYTIKSYRKNFSKEGIEAFLEENELIEKKIDPIKNTFLHHNNLFELNKENPPQEKK